LGLGGDAHSESACKDRQYGTMKRENASFSLMYQLFYKVSNGSN
jgi:hypothetical protein